MKGILITLLLALHTFAAEPIRFLSVDVFIDPKGEPLAAYQLEITAPTGVKIVGIEGGEHPEFQKAPYYDPKAIQSERVIVAAFTTAPANSLPANKTRVLTLHLQSSTASPKLESNLKISARPDGKPITAEINLTERNTE